ncbi:FAD:protein FMN transferase [Micromonospora polyrhachis]|uniref:FAD:protein FMN transferase n=1 Tax=Micromonospora polyrhachis TaxID=1282883 RepID=A0A7W7SX31_9ACTN|nr:FAD:protein FMN transferase [Micromonospora polyrhachis]MBB4962171.1 thiamine biosynthesis lipoprotein [Micromonospora polyrhachis]
MRTARWAYQGTPVRVTVTDPTTMIGARRLVMAELAKINRVCGRGRSDTELAQVHRATGQPTPVSPPLGGLMSAALSAAELTDGDVDPTIGAALLRLRLRRPWLSGGDAASTDRALPAGSAHAPGPTDLPRPAAPADTARPAGPVAGWRSVILHEGCLTVPPAVVLDLGAIVPAYAAQRCADLLISRYDGGALVGVGRCAATAGAIPADGWPVSVDTERIMLAGGALATSSGLDRNPPGFGIVDPRTGLPPAPLWAGVSVAAATCVAAKALSMAAVLRGYDAVSWLESLGVAARLVTVDGIRKSVGAGLERPGLWPAWHPASTLTPVRRRHS